MAKLNLGGVQWRRNMEGEKTTSNMSCILVHLCNNALLPLVLPLDFVAVLFPPNGLLSLCFFNGRLQLLRFENGLGQVFVLHNALDLWCNFESLFEFISI
mmetsp:Transcript_5506/g.12613  ORF Transcript_5506/g.12613 Transcript_5506/m.12613 type:complete len:100 (+) Transcript_5506:1789-2088(+)